MNFKITIKEKDNIEEKMGLPIKEYSGDFIDGGDYTRADAIRDAKEFYASELGTEPNNIKVVRVEKIFC